MIFLGHFIIRTFCHLTLYFSETNNNGFEHKTKEKNHSSRLKTKLPKKSVACDPLYLKEYA